MRLATYTSAAHEGRPRPAWVTDDGASVIPVPDDVVPSEAGPFHWLDMDGVHWGRLVSAWQQGAAGEAVPVAHTSLLAPVPRPGKLLCIGLNYRDHAAEARLPIPERPLLFSKFPTAVIGPRAAIRIPATSTQVDYEAELAVVIGRRTKQVRPEDALGVVAGYTCLNDVSARDFQFSDKQWQRGKSCDTFAPMGPWLVTTDLLGDAAALGIRLRLNGETLQDSSTAQLIFGIATLIAFLSETITLEPGDVIATGTPHGVGFARTPPVFMKAGDVVEVEIDGIGVLSNPVAD